MPEHQPVFEALNPYSVSSVPEESAAVPTEPGALAANPWKQIAWRWERLRILYNLLLLGEGVACMTLLWQLLDIPLLLGAMAYGLGANVMYSFGPLAEIYLCWFAEFADDRWGGPGWIGLFRGRHVTVILFGLGLLFSAGLTLMLAAAIGFSQTISQS